MFKPCQRNLLLLIAMIAAAALLPATASADNRTYENTTPISADTGTSPYPSPIQVNGPREPISRIVVTLRGVTHTRPQDLDVLLVSPHGYKLLVHSDTCGSTPATNRSWVFPSYGDFDYMPKSTCLSGVYRTTDYGQAGTDDWPGAPAGILSSIMGLRGKDPNGTWNLYVVDDAAGESGTIARGWSLDIDTGPAPDALIPGGIGTVGFADPYPIAKTVSGVNGVITDVRVYFRNLSHHRPDDVDAYLVGPQGQRATLMSDACGDTDLDHRSWTFDDEAANPIADGGPGNVCPDVSLRRPADYEPGDGPPTPAPLGPYPASLSAFDLTDPNGQWRLYVFDDTDGETGWFADSEAARTAPFELFFTTRPRATVTFAEGAADATEGSPAVLMLTRTGPAELGAGTVNVTTAPGTAAAGEDYRPVSTQVAFAAGEVRRTVSVETLADGLAEGAETLTVSIAQGTGDAETGTPASATVTIGDPGGGPGSGPGGGGGLPVDRQAPAISRVTVAPSAFAIAARSTAPAAARGTTIGYSLSEPAKVTLRFQRAVAGRRVGRSCRPLTAGTRRRRPCRRYVAAGTLRRTGRAGRNRVLFSGRIGRRALRRGTYRLLVSAVDAAGNRSTARPRAFQIVR